MSTKKFKIVKLWAKVFFITLLIVLFIRSFFVQSYTVSFSQMETALLKGDRVLVNKISYGIRLPISLLSIPFTFDSFCGIKSYSDFLQLDYHRLFTNEVDRNDVVLFNNPLETDKPLDKRSLFLSRCVAVPGDTINIEGWDYHINGIQYVPSPDLLLSFHFNSQNVEQLFLLMDKFNIDRREIRSDSSSTYLTLSRYEAYLLDQNLPELDQLVLNADSVFSGQLVVPKKGMTIVLNDENFKLYSSLILSEEKSAQQLDKKIFVENIEISSYKFKNNYYWFLSDNVDKATDSRSLGFIPEPNVIGKASLIWYSAGDNGIRNDRILTQVK